MPLNFDGTLAFPYWACAVSFVMLSLQIFLTALLQLAWQEFMKIFIYPFTMLLRSRLVMMVTNINTFMDVSENGMGLLIVSPPNSPRMMQTLLMLDENNHDHGNDTDGDWVSWMMLTSWSWCFCDSEYDNDDTNDDRLSRLEIISITYIDNCICFNQTFFTK